MSEAHLQSRVVFLLELAGWLVMEADRASMGKTKHKGAFFVGFCDVLAVKGERAILLELKTLKGKMREAQLAFRTRAAACGITVHEIRDEQQVVALLHTRARHQHALASQEVYQP
ncbi:VRR-NUC domain-containing protein [Deinococcus peraridilitoris]|uniref:VRR-NUC domain-containing protein n=1 Tax=Deinococcus peraridilitoris (strain DSM 19664 / LMG 22246 / CIP 109416 / KR-200) TaxID=937777 RepID=L0A3H1_DEIPD|nr:VRR-NUC domain-containing protein [Deinococcus peraridilitoris]AFZ67555.1 VRR-NUC domain-containing protein [Deinococcus peraridilitoris DSM 19664]